jgi:hypothetical protein
LLKTLIERLLLLKTSSHSSLTTLVEGFLLHLLKTNRQSSWTTLVEGFILLLLKTSSQSTRTIRGKGHLLLLHKTLIHIFLQSIQSSCPALPERLLSNFLLHNNRSMWMLRIVF